jgi:hypothetical protein
MMVSSITKSMSINLLISFVLVVTIFIIIVLNKWGNWWFIAKFKI